LPYCGRLDHNRTVAGDGEMLARGAEGKLGSAVRCRYDLVSSKQKLSDRQLVPAGSTAKGNVTFNFNDPADP
jgi:hypothetical protein